MKRFICLKVLSIFLFLFVFSSADASAEGRFREKIRERIKDRLEINDKAGSDIAAARESSLKKVVLEHDGIERHYLVYVPQSYSPSRKTPLVLAFHGGGGTAGIMANPDYYGWTPKAEKEGFIVAFPNGASRFGGKLATWNAGRCCGYARDQKSDDVGFVKALIRDIQSNYAIDPDKIFATGMSNGGMFSYRLACDASDIFRAVASVAGADDVIECHPQKPVSVLHIHAKNDDHVLFNGGAGEGAFRDKSVVTEFTSIPETISKWVKRDGCRPEAQKTFENEGAYCEAYSGCQDNAAVELCVTQDGGHSWPGAVKTPRKKAPPSTAINATDAIWDFFNSR